MLQDGDQIARSDAIVLRESAAVGERDRRMIDADRAQPTLLGRDALERRTGFSARDETEFFEQRLTDVERRLTKVETELRALQRRTTEVEHGVVTLHDVASDVDRRLETLERETVAVKGAIVALDDRIARVESSRS
ncbi:MAG: hypothetical protein NVS2B8_05770 [Vulcanimicrobiaceae bacterium]